MADDTDTTTPVDQPTVPIPAAPVAPVRQAPPAPKKDKEYTVWDSVDKRPVVVTQDTINQNAGRFEPVGNQTVTLINKDGHQIVGPMSSVDAALQAGYSYLPDDIIDHQNKVDFYKSQISDQDTAGHIAADDFLGGAPGILEGRIPNNLFHPEQGMNVSPEEKQAREEKENELKTNNPAAYYGSHAVGMAGNTLLLGGLGEDINAGTKAAILGDDVAQGVAGAAAGNPGIFRQIGASLAGHVAEGAFWNAPAAAAQLATGDYKSAAESIGAGAVFGGVLGGAFDAGGALVNKLRGTAVNEAEHLATISALKNQGVLDESGKFVPEAFDALKNNVNIEQTGINSSYAKQVLGDDAANKISNLIQDQQIQDKITPSVLKDVKENILFKTSEQDAKLQGALSSELKKPLQDLSGPKLTNEIVPSILEMHPGLQSPNLENVESHAVLKGMTNDINSLGENPSLSTVQDKINELSKNVEQIKNPVAKDVGQHIVDQLGLKTTQIRDQLYDAAKTTVGYSDNLAQKENLQTIEALQKIPKLGFLSEQGSPAAANSLTPVEKFGTMATRRMTRAAIGHVVGVPLAMAGSAVAGPVGGIVGHSLGFTAATMGAGALVSKIKSALSSGVAEQLLSHNSMGLSERAFKEIATKTPDWFGAAYTHAAGQASQSTISKIGQTLQQVAPRVGAAISQSNPVQIALGTNQSKGLSKEEQFQKLSNMIAATQASPEETQKNIDRIAATFSHDPNLQTAVKAQSATTLAYLSQNLPKDPHPNQPFQKNPWQPSVSDKKAFEDKLQVAIDPHSVINLAATGKLNQNHIDALQNLYPNMRQQMTDEVARLAHDPHTPTVSLGIKQSLSLLTGQNLANPNNINYQQNYGPAPQMQMGANGAQVAQGGGGGRKHGGTGTVKSAPRADKLPNLMTGSQKSGFGLK